MSGILSFYNKILSCGSLISDVEGRVSATLGGASRPFSSKGKRVILPTREVQLNPNKEDLVIFHPLSENILRGETEVMERYRNAINLSLNYRLSVMLGNLVELASSPARHGPLTPEHLDLLTVLKDADEKTYAAFDALLKAMPQGDTEKCFVHIFIKKNAHIKRDYRRGAIVSFPLYDALNQENPVIFGVKLRKKDHAAFKQMFEVIFPNIAEKGSYSRGGDSDLAPSLDALLKAVVAVAGQINSVIDTFADVLDELADLRFADDWVDEAVCLDNFTNEVRLLPPQVGNEGSVVAKAGVAPPTQLAPVSAPTPQPYGGQPVYGAPVGYGQQTAPVIIRTADGLLDMHAMMQANPSLVQANPMQQMGYGQPQPTGAAALRARGNSFSDPMTQFSNRGF